MKHGGYNNAAMTQQEVAERMGLALSTVKVAEASAMKKLRNSPVMQGAMQLYELMQEVDRVSCQYSVDLALCCEEDMA